MEHLQARVRQQFDHLTASQQKLARLFLHDPKPFALLTAKEIGEWSSTSESTAFRFGQALGFRGYSDLQAHVQHALLNQPRMLSGTAARLSPAGAWPEPVAQEDGQRPTSLATEAIQQLIEQEMQADLMAIQRTAQYDPVAIAQAAQQISGASNLVIVGLKASYAPAHWLAYALNIIHGHASLYRGGAEDGNSLLTTLGADSLVIGISFPRYMRETCEFMQQAQRRSARLLAITDHALSPIARLADHVLKVEGAQSITLKGMSAVFSMLHLLTSVLSQLEPEQTQARMEAYRQADTLHRYVTDDSDGYLDRNLDRDRDRDHAPIRDL